jgi:D-sedoheptulose 7-phosphate isomerase
MNINIIKDELLEAEKVLQAFLNDEKHMQNIEAAACL